MFGNTPISYEDNTSLKDVVRNQDEKIDRIHDYKMKDKWDIHPDEE